MGTLASVCSLPDAGPAHRALADATTTAHLLLLLQQELAQLRGDDDQHGVGHDLLCRLQSWPGARVERELVPALPGPVTQ